MCYDASNSAHLHCCLKLVLVALNNFSYSKELLD